MANAGLDVELPLTVRNAHILAAIARLMNVPMAPKALKKNDLIRPEDPSSDGNAWAFAVLPDHNDQVRFNVMPQTLMPNLDNVAIVVRDASNGETHWMLLFDLHDDSAREGKGLSPLNSADALDVALGEGLVRFFSGCATITYNNGETRYFEVAAEDALFPLRHSPRNDEVAFDHDARWHLFQNALKTLQPLGRADLDPRISMRAASEAHVVLVAAEQSAAGLDRTLPDSAEARARVRL